MRRHHEPGRLLRATRAPRLVVLSALVTVSALAATVGAAATATAVPQSPGVTAAASLGAASLGAAAGEAAASGEVGAGEAGGAALPPDAGVTVPSGKNEVVVDVLGLGYEQVVRLNGSRVEVVEPVTRGSGVLRSFEAGASSVWPRQWSQVPIFYGGWNMADRVGHSASRLAVAGGHIFVSNLRVSDEGTFMLREPRGTVVTKYTVDGKLVDRRYEGDEFAVTALDGFVWQGEEYLAIGFNQLGVRIVKAGVSGMPDFKTVMWHYSGSHRFGSLPTNERDQITALEFGTDGSRLFVAVGVLTGDLPALLMYDAVTGEELWAKNLRPNDPAKFEWPDVIAFGGFGGNGKARVAVGWPTLGHLDFMDAVDGAERGRITGGAVTAARFFTDASGEPRIGFRRDSSSHVAKPDLGGSPVVTDNAGPKDLEWMVPGYRAWSVQVENRSRTDVTIRTFSGPSRAEGCWHSAQVPGGSAPLPIQTARIPATGTAGPFTTAQLLRGASCGDNPGVFFAQVEPAGEPAHRQVIQVQVGAHGAAVTTQVGTGRLEGALEPAGRSGFRLIIADRHARATIAEAPIIAATRLTPAAPEGTVPTSSPDDPTRPVHRFTVSGVGWQVPGADADLTATTLPLPVAEGSVDGATWNSLGTVASPLAPSRSGDLITTGEAVFDWQTSYGVSADYRYFRVSVGGTVSNVVDASGLEAPAPTTIVSSVNMSGAGAVRANGLHQAPARVSLYDSSSQGLDTVTYAALYDRVYYRDGATKALITGLGSPDDPNRLTAFSLRPGQYAEVGGSAAASNAIDVFFSARGTAPREMLAVFRSNGTSSTVHVGPAGLYPSANALLTDGTGAAGLAAGSCDERGWVPCALMDPAAGPALHTLTATTVSVQFGVVAVPGVASLPLIHPDRPAEQLRLASNTLTLDGSRAVLQNPNLFPPHASITTELITRGERVPVENHPVTAK